MTAPLTPKRIALVGPLPPPSGGMANQTRQLAALLSEAGLSVTTIQVNAPYRPNWVGNVRGLRAVFRLLPFVLNLWRSAPQVDLFHVMANSGWSWHLFAAPAIWIAKFHRKPVVINYRGGEAASFFQRSPKIVRASLNQVAAIIVPSAFLEKIFAVLGFRTVVVPNIVNLARFAPAEYPPAHPPHLVVTRNLEAIYGIDTALRAFALVLQRFPESRMTIAGSGPQLSALQSLAGELQLAASVEFCGRLEIDDMAALYRSAHVMVNPSLVDNTPNSIIEALASGVPIVTTDVGGIPYLVENERTALLVPAQQPEAMAAAILRVLNTPQLARALSEAGLAAVKQYTWGEVKEKLFAVYAGACSPPLYA